ncbi:unnamed protein product, partial [Heterotrigona itama]
LLFGETRDYSALTVKNAMHILRFSNIDISHDRFLSGKHGGKEHASSVKQEVLSRRITQEEISSKSSQ